MQADEPFSTGRVLLIVAHSDDEAIGAGAQLARLRDRIDIVHVTNGAPDNNPGYVSARLRESLEALALAGIPGERCHELGITDQKTSFCLQELTRQIERLLSSLKPDFILTHPYEGGHPDHDSCSFAVRAAVRRSNILPRPEIWEFTSYHMGPQATLETGVFLSGTPASQVSVSLSEEQQTFKQQLFHCFASQSHVLRDFSLDAERFRRAPSYDFTEPPHPGQLYYEQFEWGVTGPEWRDLANQAFQQLGLELHATHSS